jgi:hypothetical protein
MSRREHPWKVACRRRRDLFRAKGRKRSLAAVLRHWSLFVRPPVKVTMQTAKLGVLDRVGQQLIADNQKLK